MGTWFCGRRESSNEAEEDASQCVVKRRRVPTNDRGSGFVIENHGNAGTKDYFERKQIRKTCLGQRRKQVTAVTVRERGTMHQNRVVRFLYTVPLYLVGMVKTWVSIAQQDGKNGEMLLCGERESRMKEDIRKLLSDRCILLTHGQRCAF